MTGPCAKTTVICTIEAPDGTRYVGTNYCLTPQDICPRQPGEGYDKCKSICNQVGHAENVAALKAGHRAAGGVAYVEDHTYACGPCQAALSLVGINDVRIGPPPPEK